MTEEVGLNWCDKLQDYSPLLTLVALKNVSARPDVENGEALNVFVELRDRGVHVEVGKDFERLIEDTRSASVDTSGDELASRLSELGLEQLAAMWGKDGPSARDAKLKNALHLLLDVPAEILGDDRDAILEELTEKMLKAGVDPLARRAELYQETPLTLALRKSREPVSLKVIELLADAQTDWTVPYRYGTPLAIALDKPLSKIRKDQRERAAAIIDLLRGYKEAALNGTAFTKMCENGEIEWIEQAISDGA